MSCGRRRNLLGLSLPDAAPKIRRSDEKESAASVQEEQPRSLAITETQRDRLHEWAAVRELLGDITEEVLVTQGELGRGNGGAVSKVVHKIRGIVMARKMVHLEVKPSVRTQIIKELSILHKCSSPYIVGFFGAFIEKNDISICMEYMDGRSLDIVLRKVHRLDEFFIGKITVAVIRGLKYLKEEINTMHRDVKPSNILVNSRGEIKLCDFGVSGMLVNSMAISFVGTRSYMAPERLTGTHYSIQSDIWSFGLTVTELAIGRYPVPSPTKSDYAQIFNVSVGEIEFADDEAEASANALVAAAKSAPANMAIFEMLEYIVNQPPPSLPRRIFSDDLCTFVSKCLKKLPTERATLKSLAGENFYKQYENVDDQGRYAELIKATIAMPDV